jgi:hypothetical protein
MQPALRQDVLKDAHFGNSFHPLSNKNWMCNVAKANSVAKLHITHRWTVTVD